ncbi:TonB-dependent receptor [Asticcacaulis sp.]|uniref:TonB-dependent receptor n=1 Tax=Asticcacaulis sp. TaxID=1872648 RepID=UPI0031D5101E
MHSTIPSPRKATLLRTSALVGLSLLMTAPAFAQDAAPATGDEVQTVVVTGFRNSLQTALQDKKKSNGVVDVIRAEDIAKFPDANLAESLQRVPGVSISRVAGEGRSITVRGLPPAFTRVRINGMEAQSVSGATTSDRGIGTGRGFDFNTFSSDLFSNLTVRKTASPETLEGSLGATVDLHTSRPFDYKGFTAAINGQVGYNSLSKEMKDRKVSGVISNRWDTELGQFGALASIAYTQRHYYEDQFGSGGWNPGSVDGGFCSPVGVTPQVPATDAAKGTDALNCATGVPRPAAGDTLYSQASASTTFFPRLPRYGRFEHDQKRLGASLSLQWRPQAGTTVNFDALYSNYDVTREESWLEGFSFARAISQNGKPQTAVRELILFPAGTSQTAGANFGKAVSDVAYARFDGVDVRSDTQYDAFENTFTQYTLSGSHDFSDTLSVSGLIGISESDFNQKAQTTLMFQRQNAGMTVDFRRNRDQPIITHNFDVTNPDNYTFGAPDGTASTANAEIRLNPSRVNNRYETAELNLEYRPIDILTVKTGLHFNTFSFDIAAWQRANTFLVPNLTSAQLRDVTRSVSFPGNGLDDGVFPKAWATIDYDKFVASQNIYSNSGIYALIPNAGNTRGVEEKITSGYVQTDLTTQVAGMTLRTEAGFRFAKTQLTARGIIVGQTNPVFVQHEYSDFLPSFNATLEVTPDVFLRGSAARVVSRPDLGFLTPGGNLSLTGTPSLSSGNPFLEPIRADTYDLSTEWYFGRASLLSVGAFYKDIKSYVQNASRQSSFRETGLPLSLLGSSGVDPDATPITITQPVNTPGGPLKGFEVNYQQGFSFLPGWLSHTGALFNYTYVDSEITYNLAGGGTTTKSLIGLSKNAYNGTLYYEDETISLRLSTSYRSKYIIALPANNPLQDLEGVDDLQVFDLSASYQITPKLRVTLEGLNILDEFNRQYIDSTRNSTFVYNHLGAQWNLGLQYKF